MSHLSGWCSPAPGARHTEYEHASCDRFRSGCQCSAFGGHWNAQNAVVERDSASAAVKIGATERAPDRVLGGPQSRALADCKEST